MTAALHPAAAEPAAAELPDATALQLALPAAPLLRHALAPKPAGALPAAAALRP